MKKLFFTTAIMLFTAICFASPNEKVLSNFKNAFPKADSISWYDNENDFEVHFTVGQMRCKVWYDKEGVVIKSLRYYSEDMLSPIILSSLQRKYPDKKIFGVTELTTPESIQFYIILEDEKRWYDVNSDALGNLTLTKKFNKA